MTVEELNEEVREKVAGPDWLLWKGARYEPGAVLASDKVVLAHRNHADKDVFEWMENLEGPKKHDRWDNEQAERDWDMIVSDFAVNTLTPIRFFDVRQQSEGIFPYLLLFRNETREHNILVDARRYRMLIEVVPVDRLYGTGPADALVAVQSEEKEEQTVETPTGAVAPVTDRGGRYMKIIRQMAPELGL